MEAKLGILSNKKATINFRIPVQQAYNFKGNSDTPERQTAVDNVVDKVKQDITNIISVDPALGCQYEITDINKFADAEESYEKNTLEEKKKIKAEYKVLEVDVTLNCLKELTNQKVNINFGQNFKNISKIWVSLKGTQRRKFAINGSSGNFVF